MAKVSKPQKEVSAQAREIIAAAPEAERLLREAQVNNSDMQLMKEAALERIVHASRIARQADELLAANRTLIEDSRRIIADPERFKADVMAEAERRAEQRAAQRLAEADRRMSEAEALEEKARKIVFDYEAKLEKIKGMIV
jgi:hypothetical protein